ncbi:MAG: DUF4418 family protein [Actinomyces succiniciruminis]|uniref:Uncharacterized protein n=1 Tax=Actinomyces glycerinitolerans TaxID=1892869 RepID=A0A1M4S257_9ACTO|nr:MULTISPECIES: DUF4418 family protein [Actinomyces]MBE6475431.1 DUF4418 family protein [Actinomyces succiniciruminis]MBM6979370.1 DUF4418 family protein [Actinomyces succiniciruminis]RAX19157.1 DUF4418 family protein [Actinomyces sp. Z5]SHE26261.1 Hypothetical protein ACGLYG10_2510 [Actinomyces glycerinitolerans]
MPKKLKNSILIPLIPAALSLLLVIGVLTAFSACGPKDDGTWMHCHDCQNAVAAGGAGLLVLFGASAWVKNPPLRIALQVVATVGGVVVFLIPGVICPLCMMRTMRCYTVFQPFVRIMAVLIVGSGIGALIGSLRTTGPSAA